MKMKLSVLTTVLLWLFFFMPSATASDIVQIAVDERGIPFLLDNDGHVWGFKKPFALKDPIRLSGLERIKRIAPYIAVDSDGKVFTWSLNDVEIETLEGEVDIAGYTASQRIEGLAGVTFVAHSNNHLFAVIENREIVVVPIIRDEWMFGISRYGAITKLLQREGVKAISAAPGTHTTNSSESMNFGLVALFEDGVVMGWGISSSGQIEKEVTGQWITLTKSLGASGIAMNAFHTAVLTAEGTPKFWGGCDLYGDFGDNEHHKQPLKKVLGKDGYISDVESFALTQDLNDGVAGGWGNDSGHADIFIKRDGSVWLAYAPTADTATESYGCGQYLSTVNYRQAKPISAGDARAVQVATSQGVYFLLDEKHRFWATGGNYGSPVFREIKLK